MTTDPIPDDIRAIAVRLCDCWGHTTSWGEMEDAIATALMQERERAARIAIHRADHHRDYCEPECKCANGWHIAIEIRSPDKTP